ncbi:glycosyltransferase [Plantactinospora sp. CA-290183]|uniref:glycosyltransferase n=1 Tax=Plantactinospora sp. CA-290183 TaxID=3240006 RepID=UPI003D933CFA
MSDGRAVVIWRSALLLASETFIRNQGDALTRWRPSFVGATKTESFLALDSDVIAYPDGARGRLAFLRHRLTGRSTALVRLLTQLRPAVVHAHFGGDGWLVSRAAERLGVPLVITLHGYDVTREPKAAGIRGIRYRRNLRTAFERATLVIAVSEFIRQQAIALGADPAKVRVHHIGVTVPPAPAPTPKRWDVLFVGRFVEKKGIDDLVEAVGTLGQPRPRLLFIGTGPLEAPMRERAAALGLDATFLGVQEPAVVRRSMAESRIFVSPSKTASDGDSEGLPTTILEAASLGLPTVSTRHSGIPEGVVHGETGLLGAEGDRAALARHIRQLLTDDALRTRLGDQARRHVAAHFDLRKQTALLEELYDEAAGAIGRRSGVPDVPESISHVS